MQRAENVSGGSSGDTSAEAGRIRPVLSSCRRRAVLAGLLAAVLLVYGGHLSVPLGSDARYLTYQNAFVRDPHGLAKIWTSDFFGGARTGSGYAYLSGYYRPVTNTLLWLEYRVAGERDALYNLGQVLLHWVNACLVFSLAWLLFESAVAALAAATLFAIHPVNAFAAVKPAACGDALSTVFYLLAMVVYLRLCLGEWGRGGRCREAAAGSNRAALGGRRGVALAAVTALSALAVLSKEMAVTLPAALCLLNVLLYYRDGLPLRRMLLTAPVWLAVGAIGLFRVAVLGLLPQRVGYTDALPVAVVYLNLVKNVPIYLLRIVVPHGADFPELCPTLVNFVDPTLTEPMIYLAVVLLVLLVVAPVALRRRAPTVAFLAALLLVLIAPMLAVENMVGTLSVNEILAQERWFYLPGVPIFLLLGLGSARLREAAAARRGGQPALLAAAVALALVLGRMASVHALNVTSWEAILRRYFLLPQEKLSRFDRANRDVLFSNLVALPRGDLVQAEDRCRRALQELPDSPFPVVALARVLERRARWPEMLELLQPWVSPTRAWMEEKHRTNPRVADDLNRIGGELAFLGGRALAHTGRPEEAADAFCLALRRNFDPRGIAAGLNETYSLNGPAACLAAADRLACVRQAPHAPFIDLAAPIDPASCDAWRSRFRRE